MEINSHIKFLLQVRIEYSQSFIEEYPEGLKFASPKNNTIIHFLIKRENQDNKLIYSKLIYKVYTTYPTTRDQALFADSYNNKNLMLRVADGINLPFAPRGEPLINVDGSFKETFSPRQYLCPSDIVQLIEQATTELTSEMDRFFKLLRWRQGIDAPGEIIKNPSLYWTVGDDNNYFLAPLSGGSSSNKITLQTKKSIHWDEEHQTALQKLWLDNAEEPLGHALIKEAASLIDESPRSAILIMTAALETAVKIHISRIAPSTSWLMEETSSPPVFKMLKNYIPKLHHDITTDFWDKVKPFFDRVQKLIEVRNKIAHTGKMPEKLNYSPLDYLVLVTDLLYLLDVLDGHDWAKSHVSFDFRKALDWSPEGNQATTTICFD